MKIRLLVVDDDSGIRDVISRHFRFLGFEVEVAESGNEALEKMGTAKMDIVISDIVMPGMDGVEFLRAIKTQYPMTHVIMITGYVSLDNALTCMRLGADTAIFKPIEDFAELEEAVQNAVRSVKTWLNILNRLREMKPEVVEG